MVGSAFEVQTSIAVAVVDFPFSRANVILIRQEHGHFAPVSLHLRKSLKIGVEPKSPLLFLT